MRDGNGRPTLKHLTELLEQPVRAATNPPALTVWHCSIRNHPTDRTLSDQQWQHIAAEMMAGVGLAPHADPDAVRWVAVRHGHDHIHLVATLARQDGRTAWAWNDRPKAQAVARDLEARYGLYRVGPADHTSHRPPKPAERNKAERQHRPYIPRDRLRREVRAAAAAALDEPDFFTTLRSAGILIRLRYSTIDPDQITGYAVGLPDHHTTTGDTIWYGGGRLAPDLTLPQLRHRWNRWNRAPAGNPPTMPRPAQPRSWQRADAFARAAAAIHEAGVHIAHGAPDEEAADLARAASDVLTATARAFEGRQPGRLNHAAETLDRASRQPHRRPIPRSPGAAELRATARLIFAMGRLTGDRDTTMALHLLLQLATFADTLADLRESQQRLHQARAARNAAEQLRTASTTAPAARPAAHAVAGPATAAHPPAPTPHARSS